MGFPAGGQFQMIGSDAVAGWAGSTPAVNPYDLLGKADSSSNPISTFLTISATSSTSTNGVLTIYYTRPLASGRNPILNPSAVTIIASTHDTSQTLVYHTCHVSRAYTLDLITGNGTAGPVEINRKKDAHGALMLIGWGVIFVFAVISARFGKSLGPLWFTLHTGFVSLGMTLVTVAFIISWTMVDKVFFNTRFHSQLGLTIMILAYIQVVMGVARPHRKNREDPTPARKVFEIVHPLNGWMLLVLASINIFAGISTWWPYWVIIVYAVTLFCFGVLIVVLQLVIKPGDDEEHPGDEKA